MNCSKTDVATIKQCNFAQMEQIVQNDGMKLQYASDIHKDNQRIVLDAVKQNGMALQYASENMRKHNTDVIIAAITQNGMALQFVLNIHFKSKWYVDKAIETNALALQYGTIGAKNTKETVLIAVQKNGLALQYASEDLKKDRDIVLEAVKQNGMALQYASDGLRNDEEIVREAVQNNSDASIHASVGLRNILNRPITNYSKHTITADRKIQVTSTRRSLTSRNITFMDFFKDIEVLGGIVITFIIIPVILYHTSIYNLYAIITAIFQKLSLYTGFVGILAWFIKPITSMIRSWVIPEHVINFTFLAFINKFFYYMSCNSDTEKRSGIMVLVCSASKVVEIVFQKCLQIIFYFGKLIWSFFTNAAEFYKMLKATMFVDLKTLYIFFKRIYGFTWGLLYAVYSLLPSVSMKLPLLNSSQYIKFDGKGSKPLRYVYKEEDKYIILPSESPPGENTKGYYYFIYSKDEEILYSPEKRILEKKKIKQLKQDVWEYTDPNSTIIYFQRKLYNGQVYRDDMELRPPKEDLSVMQYIVSFLDYFHKNEQDVKEKDFGTLQSHNSTNRGSLSRTYVGKMKMG